MIRALALGILLGGAVLTPRAQQAHAPPATGLIAGKVVDSDGDPIALAASWSRPDGTFQIDRLPPGNYFAVALGTLDDGSWFDPEFLKTLVEKSVRVTLVNGEPKVLDLRIK